MLLHVNAGRRKASSQVSGQVCICQEGPVGASERGHHHSKMSEKGPGFLEASVAWKGRENVDVALSES